jgi:transposase InsO family protein
LKGIATFVGVKTSDMVWHQRLGHLSNTVFHQVMSLQQLPVYGSLKNLNVWESCQLGKSKQLPFSSSSRCTKSPLELINSDVWTSPVSSMSGCRFYVIFVDDYSRYSWLYPIINKSSVFQCFVKFKLLAEKQFSADIKQLQSDNGGESTSHSFKEFLSQHGILHRLTCPHTSQQNGVAERKHKHVVELGLTLLAQSGLPPKYWVNSFLTATFLINRLPTPVLHNESPFFKLFGKDPDYTSLRSFGCLCYPLLQPYASNKLSFHNKPCIFLGYATNHYGYRCLEPQTQKVYILRHVFFDESKFPALSQQHQVILSLFFSYLS